MRVFDYFQQGCQRGLERTAFIDGDLALTWGQTREMAERLASAFVAAGLDASSRIGVYSPNDAMAFTAILAVFRLGATWTPINARNAPDANRHWLELMGCGALVYHSSLEAEALALGDLLQGPAVLICLDREGPGGVPSLERFMAPAHAPAPQPPDEPDIVASVFPTGGTTGLSKAAMWTLRTWETLIGTFWQCLPATRPPVHLVAGPMTHAAGVLALCSLPGGATNVILRKPDPGAILEAIERYGVTHLYLPPTLIYSLLEHPDARRRDYSSLEYLVVAASPISPDRLREAMEVFGPVVCQSYGQAEAPMFVTFLPARDLLSGPAERWASCGRGTLAARVEIMDDDGVLLGPGERGEIVVRGSLVMAGYLDNPQATAALDADGWRRTGDIGRRDEAGFVYIVDRARDMIITGGFNVFSVEVEQVILSHPAVRECAVIGVPDPRWGEAVKAVLELKAGAAATEAEIMALVRERLGPVHAPKSVEFWPELPRSGAGKVLKRDIRDRFWSGMDRAVG
jgi:acyl-CoA synthetase (AMP-forming)/AMP-acid ligase II